MVTTESVTIKVPVGMSKYLVTMNPETELTRNALLLYPYILNQTISHGRAAEILGIRKSELIDLYDKLGYSYFDMTMDDLDDELNTFRELKKEGGCGMIVVSDTTPLISLLKINRIDLLEKLFGDVLIPQAVFDELTVNERFRLEADEIRQKKFIVVKPVNNPESASILKRAAGLDQGESEAIVLSDELKADLLLMDEAKGRNVSAQMGLRIMGTIGILMAAYEEHELTSDEVRECVNGLQRAGRHIGQRHYQMLLSRLKD